MAQANLTLESLLATVTEQTKTLTSNLRAGNFPEPSFGEDAPAYLPPSQDIQGPRTRLIEALMGMLHLALGPNDYFMTQTMWVSVVTQNYAPCHILFALADTTAPQVEH